MKKFRAALVAALFLLGGGNAWPAAQTGTLAAYCTGAETWFKNQDACPIVLILTAGANVTETTFDVSVELAGNVTGTLHVCSDDATFDSDADGRVDSDRRDDCVNDTSLNEKQTLAVSSPGTYTFSDGGDAAKMSGLTQGTDQYTAAVVVPTGSYDTRPVTTRLDDVYPLFQAVASGGAGLETDNSRFWGTGGSDAADGLTHATRWETLSKVASESLPAGTNVYGLQGSPDSSLEFRIDWSGDADDRVVFGTYCMDGGTTPIRYDSADSDCSGGRIVIKGTYNEACGAALGNSPASTCTIGTGAVPNSKDDSLLYIREEQYITVQDVVLQDSAGIGLLIHEDNTVASNVIIDNVDIIGTFMHGIKIERPVDDSRIIVRNSLLQYNSLVYEDGREALNNNNWPGCFSVVDRADGGSNSAATDILLEGNEVRNCGGESISTVRAGGIIIRGNTVSMSRRYAYYNDNGQNNVWEHNIFEGQGYEPRSGGVNRDPKTRHHCMGVGAEDYSTSAGQLDSTGVVVRNNLFLNCADGFRLFQDSGAGTVTSVEVYGNTFTVGDSGVHEEYEYMQAGNFVVPDGANSIVVKNNIFESDAAGCAWRNFGANDDLDYNLFGTNPSGNDHCEAGANSIVNQSPGFSNDDTWDADNPPTVGDVTPTLQLNQGTALLGALLDIANYDNFGNITQPTTVIEADWEPQLALDYESNDRTTGGDNDIGGLQP